MTDSVTTWPNLSWAPSILLTIGSWRPPMVPRVHPGVPLATVLPRDTCQASPVLEQSGGED